MAEFFVLKIGSFTQHKYAWYETIENANYSDECHTCPECGLPVSGLFWLPPYDVKIKQPRNIGDFIIGACGCDFLVSEKFKTAYESSNITGIEKMYPINIVKMGTSNQSRERIKPELYGVELKHTTTRVEWEECRVNWSERPKRNYCRVCGPGGGGTGGIMESFERIVIDKNSWTGEDIFFAGNNSLNIMLSEKGAEFIVKNGFTNVEIIPCEEFSYKAY